LAGFALPGFVEAHIHPGAAYLQEEGGALLFPEFQQKQIAEAVAVYLEKIRMRRILSAKGGRWSYFRTGAP
jgi:predicted amidohydrolase YtcJ